MSKRSRKADLSTHKSFRLKEQNERVVAGLRKSKMFLTNEEVIDAALRCLVEKLKTDLAEATLTNELPSESNTLTDLPVGISPDQGVPIP